MGERKRERGREERPRDEGKGERERERRKKEKGTLLAWDHFIGSDDVGRVPIERKLARVPAPRVFHREPKSLFSQSVRVLFAMNSRISTQIGRMHMVRPCDAPQIG